ncbi:hypothetical protein N9H41_01470 [Candidatus Pelagibacter sp.]|nr:hypothetical protein [Candidatus Pelagibacter sp.]
METSRDDFVIALRSAFLKKGIQQRFSLLKINFKDKNNNEFITKIVKRKNIQSFSKLGLKVIFLR